MSETNENGSGFTIKPAYAIAVFLLIGVVGFFVLSSGGDSSSGSSSGAANSACPIGSDCEPVIGETRSSPEVGSEFVGEEDPESIYIPISDVDDGTAHFYVYTSSSGKTIKYFVLKSSDDVLRAAFDACDVCYTAGKGYRQEGDVMVCNNCGQTFPSDRINLEKGGCNPAPLDRTMEDSVHKPVPLDSYTSEGYIVIKKSDIEAGAKYF